jgi:hypothetical protein
MSSGKVQAMILRLNQRNKGYPARMSNATHNKMPTHTNKSNTTTTPWMSLLPLLLFFIGMLIIFFRGFPPSDKGFSIQSTISRGNRVVAIDTSDTPLYRWVFSTPSDYTWVSEKGALPVHEPAHISYGTGWTRPRPHVSDSVYTSLAAEEWETVEQWRKSWCREAPKFRPIPEDKPFHTVALRCHGYNATTFRLLKDELPIEIATLLRRATTSTDEIPRVTIEADI